MAECSCQIVRCCLKNTCRLNAKGAFCPLHTSPAALSQTSSARFFDSLRAADSRPYAARSTWSVGRGAYTPPNQAAGITGLAVIAARPWRHMGMPPYGVRRWCGGNRGRIRADIQSAPTDAHAAFSAVGAAISRPCRAAGIIRTAARLRNTGPGRPRAGGRGRTRRGAGPRGSPSG